MRENNQNITKIKYYKPNWNIEDYGEGDLLVFIGNKRRWEVIGKTKSGYLKLKLTVPADSSRE